MGGMQALQRIKALYPDVCVLMVTANDDRSTAQETLALGAADYLKKPFDLDYLDAVLEIYLTVSDAPPGTVFSAMAAAAQSSPTNSPTRSPFTRP
jgi:DNA-binding response OmpR family regulator